MTSPKGDEMKDPTMGMHRFEVISNEAVADGVWRMRCDTCAAAELSAGQFVNLAVPGDGAHILRIPLSFSAADCASETLELVYAVVGEGTRRLSAMRPGDESTLIGPCGRGWSLPTVEGRALLVAGGVGLPPIVACARMLRNAGIEFDAIVGAQTANRHVNYLLEELGEQTIVCTDDGTRGINGFVTVGLKDLIAEHPYSCIYTCGPNIMMGSVAKMAHKRGIACQASLERMMGCGFGACSCCNVRLASGENALCCVDGPVFDAEEVAW